MDRNVEGVVEMVLDATTNHAAPLSASRIFGWHAALFPTGYSGMSKISIGAWRDDASGPMQVISGPVGREKVHFQAPPAEILSTETTRFLDWANEDIEVPSLLKAGLAHLWFVTLHPFDDGNGRIARAVGDLFLARADGSSLRYYSLSAQIQRDRADYYAILERTQKGTLDVTSWLSWFLSALQRALIASLNTLDVVFLKASYWQRWSGLTFNERQVKLLNRLLDGFDGKLTTGKWGSISKCSPDTALRDIKQLISLGVLEQTSGGGRSTGYQLVA